MESKRPPPYSQPRLVTRSSRSDLMKMLMNEAEKERPSYLESIASYQSDLVKLLTKEQEQQSYPEPIAYTTKTVTKWLDLAEINGRPERSPQREIIHQTSTYSATVGPVGGRPSYEPEAIDTGSPSALRSSLSRLKADELYSEEVVTMYKTYGFQLGLSIVGGKYCSCWPFGESPADTGIFISKVFPNEAAARTGRLFVGDRIVRVNGQDMARVSHADAVTAALSGPSQRIDLTVRHDPSLEGLQELIIRKNPTWIWGMDIRGGDDAEVPGNPFVPTNDGIFISKIWPYGAVARDGRLKAGMRILAVNDESLFGCSHEEAESILRQATDELHIMICEGYDGLGQL